MSYVNPFRPLDDGWSGSYDGGEPPDRPTPGGPAEIEAADLRAGDVLQLDDGDLTVTSDPADRTGDPLLVETSAGVLRFSRHDRVRVRRRPTPGGDGEQGEVVRGPDLTPGLFTPAGPVEQEPSTDTAAGTVLGEDARQDIRGAIYDADVRLRGAASMTLDQAGEYAAAVEPVVASLVAAAEQRGAGRAVISGRTAWRRSTGDRAADCICCPGAHVYGYDVVDDLGEAADLMMPVWRAIRALPEGSRVEVRVVPMDGSR